MDVEEALDTLYRTAPEAFVGTRTGLVRDLKAAGDREAADFVQKLRRPTAAIWAVNQLAHADAQGIAGLLDATQRLAAAQGGDAAAFMMAGRERRDVLHGLATRAATLLHEVGVRADKFEEVSAILDAASMQPDLVDTLLRGRLAELPERPTGFELAFGVEPTEAEPRPADDEQQRRQADRSSVEHAVRRARERVEQLTAAVVAAQQTVERLEDELARARQRAGKVTEEVEAARADLIEAEEALNRTF